MSRFRVPYLFLFLLIVLATLSTVVAQSVPELLHKGHHSYEYGELESARSAFTAALTKAEAGSDRNLLWQTLMSSAWFEEALGEHRKAIDLSNRALDAASSNKNEFQIGRSLIWVAWSYASIGLYELALELLEAAVEIGAPEGKIKIVPVWGFALQEMGHIYLRMGELSKAQEAVELTANFARQRGIAVGIAEGGVYLSEIAYQKGELSSALALAEEAYKAALDCACSPFNTARAMLQLAKTRFEVSKNKPDLRAALIDQTEAAIAFAEKIGTKRYIAEGQILLSKMLSSELIDKRIELSTRAFELLAESEDEFEGSAQAHLGLIFAQKEELTLAKFYLERGVELNATLFRKLDKAYALTALANVQGLSGDMSLHLSNLEKATLDAENSEALPLAADNQEQLSMEYERLGFKLLAYRWGKRALHSIEKLLTLEKDPQRLKLLELRQLTNTERLAALLLILDQDQGRIKP